LLQFREFQNEDAEAVSNLIRRNLLEVNSKDYSQKEIERLHRSFSPKKVISLSNKRDMIVAEEKGEIFGTASLGNYGTDDEPEWTLYTVFVLPEYHNRGIGKNLVKEVEKMAVEKGGVELTVPASITAHDFYINLGYYYADGVKQPNQEGLYLMRKKL